MTSDNLTHADEETLYDYVIIGSGFGGSVSALRLSEKGYKVCVLEAGKRQHAHDFPKSNWKVWKFLWAPKLFCYGIQRLTLLKDIFILSGSGVGGGSLVYANTLLVPPDEIFQNPKWPKGTPWKERLAPFYTLAKRMLGVAPTPRLFAADHVLKNYAQTLGREATFHSAQVGVYFGDATRPVSDPYFNGEGPARQGCNFCGGCMVGCRFGAKNTLDRNYLYLAEKRGARIIPERLVTHIEEAPISGGGYQVGGYQVHTVSTTSFLRSKRMTLRTRGVVVSAGVLGTLKLLLTCKIKGLLPRISNCLGDYVRTNSEAIVGVRSKGEQDYSQGLAITSGIYVDPKTHIEVVRYPKGSDAMGLLATLLADGHSRPVRILNFLKSALRHPLDLLRTALPFGWAKSTIILLVMQTLDNSIRIGLRRFWLWPFSKVLTSSVPTGQIKAPTYIPAANQAARAIAQTIDGVAQSSINEVLFNVGTTAHILGGASMGSTPQEGVIDAHNRLFGYDNFYVIDGSMVPCNLGVNPSLTITAMAEHAMSHIPNKPGATPHPPIEFTPGSFTPEKAPS